MFQCWIVKLGALGEGIGRAVDSSGDEHLAAVGQNSRMSQTRGGHAGGQTPLACCRIVNLRRGDIGGAIRPAGYQDTAIR